MAAPQLLARARGACGGPQLRPRCGQLPRSCRPATPFLRTARFATQCIATDKVTNGAGGTKPENTLGREFTLPEGYKAVEEARRGIAYGEDPKLKVFSGTANTGLTQEVCHYLGLDPGERHIKRFADGEIYVDIQESIRGCDVYLIQPTGPPSNDTLMELLILVDACRRASAGTITTVMPYFGYARADRKMESKREAITAKLVANLLTQAGVNRVITLDIHSLQCVGYFDIPVDNIHGEPVLLDYLASKDFSWDDVVIVSPDVGGVARARAFAKKIGRDTPLAIVDKRRAAHNEADVMNVIGSVEGKIAILVDDMIDTGGTIAKGAEVLLEHGATEVYACCTHPVFSPPAIERLSSGVLTEVIATNSLELKEHQKFPQLTVLSSANLIANAIWRVHASSAPHYL